MRAFFAVLTRRQRYVVCELFLVFFAIGVALIMLGSVLPMLKSDYGLDYRTGGLLLSFQSLGYVLAGLFTGALSLRFGQKRAYVGMYALLLIGFLMLLMNGAALWLLMAMLIIGLGKGAVADYNNAVINAYSGGSGTPLNLMHACFAVGACLAPFIVLACTVKGASGWRLAVCAAAALVLMTLIGAGLMQIEPVSTGEHAEAEQSTPLSTGEHAETQVSTTPLKQTGFLRERPFWQSSLIGFFYQAIESPIMGWLTTFYVDSGVMGAELAQVVTSLLWVALLVGRLLCSALAARYAPGRMIVVMCSGILVFLTLLIVGGSLPLVLGATLGLGLCMSGMYGTTVANAGAVFAQYPVSMGIFVSVTGAGAAISPTLVGLIADRAGVRAGFGVLLAAGLLLLLVALTNLRQAQKKKQRAPLSA